MKYIYLLLLAFVLPLGATAQFFYTPPLLVPYLESAPVINSRAAVLIDAHTGALLFSKNPDKQIPPASLTKVMTMHLLLNEVKAGRASLDDVIPVTVESWAQNQPPRSSLMFLEPGQIVTLREILTGLAVPSGNDAAVAAALWLAPSVADFANLMTAEARNMGLTVTSFVEPSGFSESNMTTAEEFAFFSYQYLRLHPESLYYFHSVQSFTFPTETNVREALRSRRPPITQDNRNRLLRTFPGADGIKTGFINKSGYNISLTAQRDETRLIAVTLGAPTPHLRAVDGDRLLSWAFDNFRTVRPTVGVVESARLWKGRTDTVGLVPSRPADFTAPVNRGASLTFETFIPEPLVAPLPAGTKAGYLVISDEYGELSRTPLITAADSERGSIFRRIWHSILLLFQR